MQIKGNYGILYLRVLTVQNKGDLTVMQKYLMFVDRNIGMFEKTEQIKICINKDVDGIEGKTDFDKITPTLNEYTKDGKVPLSAIGNKDIDDYIGLIIPNLSEFLPEYEDLCLIHSYFEFDSETEELFIKDFVKPYIKEGKSEGDFKKLCAFLHYVITECTQSGKRAAGAQVTKLNAKNMEILKSNGEDIFGDNNMIYGKFTDILNTEPEKGSIFKKLFGRK